MDSSVDVAFWQEACLFLQDLVQKSQVQIEALQAGVQHLEARVQYLEPRVQPLEARVQHLEAELLKLNEEFTDTQGWNARLIEDHQDYYLAMSHLVCLKARRINGLLTIVQVPAATISPDLLLLAGPMKEQASRADDIDEETPDPV